MLTHGLPKLMSFGEKMDTFRDPLGIGSTLSLSGTILGEVIAPIFIIAGLFTRLTAVPYTFTMLIAGLVFHSGDPFGRKELALLFCTMGLLVLIMGPGKYSADQYLLKKR